MSDFDVFLSHNVKDRTSVEQIAHMLTNKHGIKVWLDKWNLIPGEPWQEEIEAALNDCKTAAIFLGPSGLGPWENSEMRVTLNKRIQNKILRVIPVLLPGAPDNKYLEIPDFLSMLTWVDFRLGLDDPDAMHRLVSGIKGISPGPSVAANSIVTSEGELPEPGPLPFGSRLPFNRNALFTGREDALQTLANNLLNKDGGLLITQAVSGMGGIGKTQLAVEFAYRFGRNFRGVHWLNAADPDSLNSEIALCGKEMGIQSWPEMQDEQVALTVYMWKQSGPRLLVLDNFETIQSAREWLRVLNHPHLRILITSRRMDWPLDLGLNSLPLEMFNETESLNFLRQYLSEDRATDEWIRTLSGRLGYLPLALELAGRYLDGHPRMAIQEYLVQMTEAIKHPSMNKWRADLGNPTGHDLDLLTTFALSWNSLKNKEARKLFHACGYCAPNEPIPPELLENTIKNKNAYDDILILLVGVGLLKPGPVIHPLLAEFARALDKGNEALIEIASTLAQMTTKVNDQIDKDGKLDLFVPFRSHLPIVGEYAEKKNSRIATSLFDNLGHFLQKITDLAGAKAAYEHVLAMDENTFGLYHPIVANDVKNLGWVLKDMGELPEAKATFERALSIDEQAFGADHPVVADDVKNLGWVLKDMNELPEAKATFERALSIDEQAFGANHHKVATNVNNLGWVLKDMGNLPEARATFERAIAIDEQAFGPIHPDVARDANNLGWVLKDMRDLRNAKVAFERALEIDEKIHSPIHPDVARDVDSLGWVLKDMGDLRGAKVAFERALQIDEAILGSDHPSVARDANNIGRVLKQMRDLGGAKAAFERALQIDEATYGPGHPLVVRDVSNLGWVLKDMGDLRGAKVAFERVLQIDEALLGVPHRRVARDANNLGWVLKDMGDLPGAKTLFERALRIYEAVLGLNHPRVARAANNLGWVLKDAGNLRGAKAAFKRALRIDEAILGLNHPRIARDANNLGWVLKDMGDLRGAKAAFERALEIFEKFLPPNHPSIKIVKDNLESLE